MATSPSEKKPWWLTTKKIVDKYVKESRFLIPSDAGSALVLLDAALSLAPRHEPALELKARCLLHLRRFKDVADMLQDHIPSYKMSLASDSGDFSGESDNSSHSPNKERVKLLNKAESPDSLSFKCFSVSDLKNKLIAGLCKSCEIEAQWRYIVLGQACCHLGLMEDAMALLQTGKRLASAAFRRRSNHQSEDSFSDDDNPHPLPPPQTPSDSESITHLIAQIKHLRRRRAAAVAAMNAGLHSESIRHFSKILDGRRPAPQPFLADCYLHRSAANRAAGKIADSIADANKTLALEPSSVAALISRASLFELINRPTDAAHDLEHAKLLLNAALRHPNPPAWKSAGTTIPHREIPGRLCQVAAKIQRLKSRIAGGDTGVTDHHALVGIRKGCSRSELDRAHLLLIIKHKPDRALTFLDRCELFSEPARNEARDRARMSSLILYRMIQKGYSSISAAVGEDERRKAAVALQEAQRVAQVEAHRAAQDEAQQKRQKVGQETGPGLVDRVYQGGFCRESRVVGNLLSQTGFSRPLSVKYEGLSC